MSGKSRDHQRTDGKVCWGGCKACVCVCAINVHVAERFLFLCCHVTVWYLSEKARSNLPSGRRTDLNWEEKFSVCLFDPALIDLCSPQSQRFVPELLNIAKSSCSHTGYTFKGERGSERTRDLCLFLGV